MIVLMAYLAADLVVRALPTRAADALACGIARLAFWFGAPVRRQLEANLLGLWKARGHTPSRRDIERRARQSFENFAISLTDFLRLPRLNRELPDRVELHGAEHFARARASGRGVIVLSAHVGNWEWGAAYVAAHGTPIRVIARSHGSRWVDAFFQRRRDRCGVAALEGAPSWLAASRALRRNEWVALMGDRAVPGHSTSVCAWAAALSRRTGALLLPAVMLRRADGGYAACFEAPLTPDACRSGGYVKAMEAYLDRDPAQWFAFEPLPEGLA